MPVSSASAWPGVKRSGYGCVVASAWPGASLRPRLRNMCIAPSPSTRFASGLKLWAQPPDFSPRLQVCLHCGSGGGRNGEHGGVVCDSLDCGVYYERNKVAFEMAAAQAQLEAALPLLE